MGRGGAREGSDSDSEEFPSRETADLDSLDSISRDESAALLSMAGREAHYKVSNGRVRSEEKEKIRIQWVRALAYSVGELRQLQNDVDDREIDELREQVAELRSAVESMDHGSQSGGYRIK